MMEFKLKENIDPKILEDLGFRFYTEKGWMYEGDISTKITLKKENIEMPLIMYYLIKLDLVEII